MQVRTVCDGKIQRRDETVAAADVERDVEAAVGDRVFYIAGGDRRVATVVGNNADGTHDLVLCGDENAAHEANHALGWASGEELPSVAGAAIELDNSFSTKARFPLSVHPHLTPALALAGCLRGAREAVPRGAPEQPRGGPCCRHDGSRGVRASEGCDIPVRVRGRGLG